MITPNTTQNYINDNITIKTHDITIHISRNQDNYCQINTESDKNIKNSTNSNHYINQTITTNKQSCILSNKYITAILKMDVWNTFIGEDITISKCLLCNMNDIQQLYFHCAYVVPKSKGGSNIVSNLRPICPTCNDNVSTHNMIDFAVKYYPNSTIHKTFDSHYIDIQDRSDESINQVNTSQDTNINDNVYQNISTESTDCGFKCQYCQHSFVSKSNLNKHQKFNCKMIPLDKKTENNVQNIKDFVCEHCFRHFSRKDHLNRHIKNNCKKKHINENISEQFETNIEHEMPKHYHNDIIDNETTMIYKENNPLIDKLINIIGVQSKLLENQSKFIENQMNKSKIKMED